MEASVVAPRRGPWDWVAVAVGWLGTLGGTAIFGWFTWIHAGWPFTSDSGISLKRAVTRLVLMLVFWSVVLSGCIYLLRQPGRVPAVAVLSLAAALLAAQMFLVLSLVVGI